MTGQQTHTYVLRGGLDLVNQSLSINPGRCIAAENYQCVDKGYQRIGGFERYDGHPKPHRADYWLLTFYEGSASIATGETVVGQATGATGVVMSDQTVLEGTIAGGDAYGYLLLSTTSGHFIAGEGIQVGGVTKARASAPEAVSGAPTDAVHQQAFAMAIAAARSMVAKPAGSGPIRGVGILLGGVYCWRDDEAGTAGQMFKATPSGWQLQNPGNSLLRFDTGGPTSIQEGDVITGATSAATATVRRMVETDSRWSTTAAIGHLVLSDVTGTFNAGEFLQIAGVNRAKAVAAQSAIAIPPGGKYDVAVNNFYGQAGSDRLYFANGVGPAFEWDGEVLSPVLTGLPDDLEKPAHIAAHNNHLFLGYRGGSFVNSEIGNPLGFDATGGAAEHTIGTDVTGLLPAAQTALIVFGRSKVAYLSGTSAADFILKEYTSDSGAREWTAQKATTPLYVDDAGVRDLTATADYGDWRMGTVTSEIAPLFSGMTDGGVLPCASIRARKADQYRLFFDDGSGISVYLGRKKPECMTFRYPFVVTSAVSGESTAGMEMLIVGGDDGMVYELDVGTSFDGADIEAFIRLAFNDVQSPTSEKRFCSVTLHTDAQSMATLGISADFSYGDEEVPPTFVQNLQIPGGGGFWNQMFWDRFYWSAPSSGKVKVDTPGIGQNIAPTIVSVGATEEPHVLSAVTINFMMRKGLR